jgi:hypothetical protein
MDKFKIYRIDILFMIIVLTIVVTTTITYSRLYDILWKTKVINSKVDTILKHNELILMRSDGHIKQGVTSPQGQN